MKEETRQELDELMDTYDRKRRPVRKRVKGKRPEENLFLGTFSVCRERTIRPAMQEIGEHLRSRGHGCNVVSSDERVDADGKVTPAAVTIEFYPAGIARRRFVEANTPHVSFVAQPSRGKVSVDENSVTPRGGGWFGSKGEFSLEEIDSDLVQEQIVPMVREVLISLSR